MSLLFPGTGLQRCLPAILLLSLTTTAGALAQPTIIAISPGANTRAAPRTTAVTVSFSQPLTTGSALGLKVYSAQRGGLLTSGTPVLVNGSSLSFSPGSGSFKPGETVVNAITRTVASSAGPLARARVVQFTTAVSGSGQGNFQLGGDINAGLSPEGVVVGDVDGDGDLDLLTANTGGDNVGVRLNDGFGVYSGVQSVAVGRGPEGVVVGDVDGDGDLDLLTANYGSNNVSVRLNNGLGAFSGTQTVTVGSGGPQGLALGDVDGDGDLDLAVANQIGNTVSIRLNGGNATGSNTGIFSGNQEVPQISGAFSVSFNDVDGDGDLDLLATSLYSNIVRVVLNGGDATGSGTGLFSNGSFVTVGFNPTSLAVGDVDGDGDLDLLTANFGSNTVSVRLNNGLGIFNGTQAVVVGPSPHGVVLGDVDADGDLDLLTANASLGTGGNTVSVRLNGGNASGSSTGVFSAGRTITVGATPRNLAVGDVDDDGDLDFLTANSTGNTVTVRLNQPTVVAAPVITGISPTSAAVGATVTVTGTGLRGITSLVLNGAVVPLTDISSTTDTSFRFVVPIGAAATGTFTVTTAAGRATRTGFTVLVPSLVRIVAAIPAANALNAPRTESAVAITFTEAVTSATAQNISVYSAQAGGKKAGTVTVMGNTARYTSTLPGSRGNLQPGEIIRVSVPATVQAASGLGAGKQVYAFTAAVSGTGRGAFLPGNDLVATNYFPTDIAVADIDADGDLDLLTVNYNTDIVDSWLNNGTGTFTQAQSVSVAFNPYKLAMADIDGDGDLDMLVSHAVGSSISVRLNNGLGVFSGTQRLFVGSLPLGVAAADVDGDGDLDVLTANANNVSINYNNGAGSFTLQRYVSVPSASESLAVGDIDGDGDQDLLTANFGSSTVSVRLNDGDGIFGGSQDLVISDGAKTLTMGDMDGDGDLDLLVASLTTMTISVFANDGAGNFGSTQNVPLSGNPQSMAVADVDSDGDLDLLVTNNRMLSTHFNNGLGSFGGALNVSTGYTPGSNGGPRTVILGDVDGDGDLDALVATTGNSSIVTVKLNGATGPLSARAASTRLSFTLAPNPAKMTVRVVGSPTNQPIQLLDVLGRLIRTVPAGKGETTLFLTGLPAGVYFVQIGQEVARLIVE